MSEYGKRPAIRRRVLSPPPDKPCPVCYGPMKKTGPESWECEKHGAPKKRRI